jgi:hypothetical protein
MTRLQASALAMDCERDPNTLRLPTRARPSPAFATTTVRPLRVPMLGCSNRLPRSRRSTRDRCNTDKPRIRPCASLASMMMRRRQRARKQHAAVGESMLACKTRAAIVAIALAPSAMVVATTRQRLSRQQKKPVAPSVSASSSLPVPLTVSWSIDVEDASTVSVGRHMHAPLFSGF